MRIVRSIFMRSHKAAIGLMRALGDGLEKFTVRMTALFFPLRIFSKGGAPTGLSRLSLTLAST
jgi:hypothetical protein